MAWCHVRLTRPVSTGQARTSVNVCRAIPLMGVMVTTVRDSIAGVSTCYAKIQYSIRTVYTVNECTVCHL